MVTFASQGLTASLDNGRVSRIRTTNTNHQTLAGFGPGQTTWDAARSALCQGVSTRYDTSGGFEIRCPLTGIIIEVAGDRMIGLSVVVAEGLSQRPRDPQGPPAQGLPPLPQVAGTSSSGDQSVIQLVNTARATSRTCGDRAYSAASPVKWNDRIAWAARIHALDLAIHGGVSHQGSDRSMPDQRLDRVGYRLANFGENVAGGQATSEEVVATWLGSSGHCAIIMTADFTEAGAAWGRGPGRYRIYWTLVMARPR